MDAKEFMALGAENVHPRWIGTVDGRRCFIADTVGDNVVLNDYGRQFVAEKTKKKPGRPPKQPETTQEPEAAPEAV